VWRWQDYTAEPAPAAPIGRFPDGFLTVLRNEETLIDAVPREQTFAIRSSERGHGACPTSIDEAASIAEPLLLTGRSVLSKRGSAARQPTP
jgi:hypothetical protein